MPVARIRTGPAYRIPAGPTSHPASRIARRVLPIALALLAACAFAALVTGNSAFNVAPQTSGQWRPLAVGVLLLAAIGTVVALGLRRPRAARIAGRVGRSAWWVVLAACLGGQLVLAHAVLQYSTWDAMQIFDLAYHVAVAPEPRLFSVGDESAYFSLYPNNAFLVAVLVVLFSALKAVGVTGIGQFLWATVVLNCVVLTGTLALTRTVVRRLAPGTATMVTLVLGVVLVGVSPWLNVAYSDTLAMPVPIAMLALWLAWPLGRSSRSDLVFFALIGLLTAVGTAIKPPVAFMAVSLLLVVLWPRLAGSARPLRVVAKPIAGAGVGFLVAYLATKGVSAVLVPGFTSGAAMPFTHFMAMGATGDGGFNQPDFDSAWALPAGARAKAGLFLYLQRVERMGPIGYPFFLAEKVLYAFSDGTFFQGREGIGPYDRSYLFSDPFSTALQQVFPLGSPLHWVLASVWQAAWWCAVALCFVPLRRLRLPRPDAVWAMRIAVVLLIAFLCISESRSRYLYHYLPVLLVLAGLGAAALRAEVMAFADSRRSARPV